MANYNVLRVDHLELTHDELGPVKIADFTLPAGAVTHPAVLTSMFYPSSEGPIGSRFFFTLLMNDRELFSDMALVPGQTLLVHGRFRQRSASMTSVIPVVSPPILRSGNNTLSIRPDSHEGLPESPVPTSFSGGSRTSEDTSGADAASSCPSLARPAPAPASRPSPRRFDPRAQPAWTQPTSRLGAVKEALHDLVQRPARSCFAPPMAPAVMPIR